MSATGARARQRERARQAANEARSRRADLKAKIHERAIDVAELVDPDVAESGSAAAEFGDVANELRVFELLLEIPGVGEATVDEILDRAGVQGHRRLGTLSVRQGEALAISLRELVA